MTYSRFNVIGKIAKIEIKQIGQNSILKLIIKTSRHSFFCCDLFSNDSHDKNNLIKLSLHRGSRLTNYMSSDAIDMIYEHLSVGDIVNIKGYLQQSRSDDSSDDETYENFHLRQLVLLDDNYPLPDFAQDAVSVIETDAIFSRIKEEYKIELIFVYKKNGIIYTIKKDFEIDSNLKVHFESFGFGQLLKLHGRFDYYVELVEVDSKYYFKNNIIKKFVVLGGEVLETIYDYSLFENKALDVFSIENNNNKSEYDF